MKFFEAQFDGETYLENAVCISTLGAALGLVSIHRAVGSWKAVFSLVLKFPPLLFLPIFGFVTFGATPKGEALLFTPCRDNLQELVDNVQKLVESLQELEDNLQESVENVQEPPTL